MAELTPAEKLMRGPRRSFQNKRSNSHIKFAGDPDTPKDKAPKKGLIGNIGNSIGSSISNIANIKPADETPER
eukprot:gene24636-10593_t